ncbi:2-amino-3-carboxymuconate-6-semialdehyde decarboxylase [Tolypocladium ophioglossoides CBS 100239]|uniref:6-methylsalicylate decarboxylase n=1 Tax=Tolypocladium ophioglossoides (strain CBS 100239) TaxID=1163406 RepID=A0A0L0N4X2_TOLOC|nr:2-amino-3-carboxymuconate-6-semialdehyde decarboxylase [Tolypocladium ophioglossoides CBS 100239]
MPSHLTMRRLVAFALMSMVAATSHRKIDVHSHFLPDFYQQALREVGYTPEDTTHLQFMDKQNISKSYLSISSPGVYLNVPSVNATKQAIDLSRRINVYASQLKVKYPNKFGFFASLPLPDVNASLVEIEYCFTKLHPKPDGVVFMSNFYGLYLGDPALDPVYEALNALNVTIFEHPNTPCSEAIGAMYNIHSEDSGITFKQWRALNRPLDTRQFAIPILDFPFETARIFQDLFISRIPTRFSHLKWIIPHAGGALLSTMDRIVTYSTCYPGLNLTEDSMKETLARSFYFDLAGPWKLASEIPSLQRWVDYTKILWGTDVPWTPWALGAAVAQAFDAQIGDVFDHEEEIDAVSWHNAEQLFGESC